MTVLNYILLLCLFHVGLSSEMLEEPSCSDTDTDWAAVETKLATTQRKLKDAVAAKDYVSAGTLQSEETDLQKQFELVYQAHRRCSNGTTDTSLTQQATALAKEFGLQLMTPASVTVEELEQLLIDQLEKVSALRETSLQLPSSTSAVFNIEQSQKFYKERKTRNIQIKPRITYYVGQNFNHREHNIENIEFKVERQWLDRLGGHCRQERQQQRYDLYHARLNRDTDSINKVRRKTLTKCNEYQSRAEQIQTRRL